MTSSAIWPSISYSHKGVRCAMYAIADKWVIHRSNLKKNKSTCLVIILQSSDDMIAICRTPWTSAQYRLSVERDRFDSHNFRRMYLIAIEIKDMDYYREKTSSRGTSNNLSHVKYEATWAVEASAPLARGQVPNATIFSSCCLSYWWTFMEGLRGPVTLSHFAEFCFFMFCFANG